MGGGHGSLDYLASSLSKAREDQAQAQALVVKLTLGVDARVWFCWPIVKSM